MEVSVPHNLEELKRNKLQALCKTFKIPANLKNVELIKRLKEIREQQQLCNKVVSNDHDPQWDNTAITITGTSVHDEGLSKHDQMLSNDNVVVDDALLHHDDDDIAMVTTNDDNENTNDAKKRATGNRMKRKAGHSKKQRRGRRARVIGSSEDVMGNRCVIDDHVIYQCPESANAVSHSDNLTINTPAAVFTPAKEIINEDSVISSSARRRRKCWSEVQHNESIEELFDRMAAETTAKAEPSAVGGNDSVTSGVTQSTAPGTDDILQEHIQDDDQPLRKRRRRSTFDVESSTTLSNVTDDDDNSSPSAQHNTPAPCSNRGSLSNQFMKQKKQKPVAIGNSSLLTEQSLSPLVTNSQSAPSGGVSDEDKVKEEVTAMLEDRVKLRKSQTAETNTKERDGATSIAGQKRKQGYSVTTNNSKIPVAQPGKKAMTSKDFDRIHQRNFNRSQSIVEYNDRKQRRILSSVTPLSNSSNKRNNITGVNCTTTGYKFKQTEPRLNHTASSVRLFNFTATSTTKQVNKRHKETAERRKSYNAQNSAKKKPRNYKPYTGKLPPLQPIKNF